MSTFHLQIVTPERSVFDGQAQRVLCRTIAGDVCILPRHCDYITALGMGEARVTFEDSTVRPAACIGGLLTVRDGQVRLVATTFEWVDELDEQRVEASRQQAQHILDDAKSDAAEVELASARLKRALVRSSVLKRHR